VSLVDIPGGLSTLLGPSPFTIGLAVPSLGASVIDAANEAVIFVGQIVTSDGGSHTIDTTGSSAIGWATQTVTFANAGTTVKVGLGSVDAANGPPARGANSTDVITFDVSKSLTGGGGGITGSAWQTHVPDTGTKTIANGDLVVMAIQMTARGGADTVQIIGPALVTGPHRPTWTEFTGGAYTIQNNAPNAIITFSDGTLGYFYGGSVLTSISTRTWNSGSATKEYGQLYQMPFPMKVHGIYGWVDPDADFDAVLYSDPLGTSPVAEKTVSFDANVMASSAGRRFTAMFAAPYLVAPNTPVGAVFKPGGSSISGYYKTMANAAYRIVDPWGTSGYGISRASGAFANANSSLDHYYIGLLVSSLSDGGLPASRMRLGM
jgi:hypothetical protein